MYGRQVRNCPAFAQERGHIVERPDHLQSRRWRLPLGGAIVAASALLVGVLVATFTANGNASARTTVWIIAAVLWPVPIAIGATVAWRRPGERVVRVFLRSLYNTVAAIPFVGLPLALLGSLVLSLWPGPPPRPSGLICFFGTWILVGFAPILHKALADKSDPDPYAGGWAP